MNFLLVALSGFFLSISFPKAELSFFVWIALVPFFEGLRNLSVRDSFKFGLYVGLIYFSFILNWLFYGFRIHSNLGLFKCLSISLIFLLYLATYLGLFAALISYLIKKLLNLLIVAPSCWVILEFFRGFLFTGFPWGFIGHTQFNHLKIIQISDLFGVYGVSFFVVFSNVLVYILFLYLFNIEWRGEKILFGHFLNSFLIVFFVFVLVLGYGSWRIKDIKQEILTAKYLKVGLVQGNIDQGIKWKHNFQLASLRKYFILSDLLLLDHPDLVIWPETAIPFLFENGFKISNLIIKEKFIVDSRYVNFVIGSPTFSKSCDKNDSYYNSAFLTSNSGRVRGQYDKVHLVPFGEYKPLKALYPSLLETLAENLKFEKGLNKKSFFFISEQSRIGIQICYEILFSNLSRETVMGGAKLLLNLTNDAWFGASDELYQHFSFSIFRAIETRRAMIRVANTGISSFISPTGSILTKTSILNEEVLIKRVPMLSLKTVYSILGDIFILICLICLIPFFLLKIKG